MLELWPYTNFHDLNLDWIIETIKVYTKKVDDLFNFGLYDYVEKVLAAHPEWTTTVMDGAITMPKLASDVIDRFETVEKNRLIFMPVPWSSGVNSDCTVISTSAGKNIMFDTGHANYWTTIRAKLVEESINHIDVLVISHYHADHYGNVDNLIGNGYLTSDSMVYLPKIGYLHSSQLTAETATINSLTTAGISYDKPDSGTQVLTDNVRMQFFNCDQADMTYYDTDTPGDENNYSMCVNVTCGDMFTLGMYADIGMKAQQRIYAQGWLIKNDIMHVPHHANDETAYDSFYLATMPDIGIAMQTAFLLEDRQYTGYAYSVVPAYGGKMYSTGNGTIHAAFNEYGYHLTPNSESLSGGARTISLYIDASHTGDSDGSVNKPFPTLREALAASKKYKGINIDIKPVSTYTDAEELIFRNTGNQITLKDLETGNIVCYPGTVLNLSNVALSKADDALLATGANINGSLTIKNAGARGAVFYNTKAVFDSLTINDKTTGFAAINNSDIFVTTYNGSGVTYGVSSANGSRVSIATNNMSATNTWDHNNDLGGVLGDFTTDISSLKTADVTSVSKMQITRRDNYNVVHLDIGVSLSSGVAQITSALPRDLQATTPIRVPIVGRQGGSYATATNYIGELFINNGHEMFLVFGNSYTNINYVTCECTVLNKTT